MNASDKKMCRMIVASGNIDVLIVIKSIISMADDENSRHEMNEKTGPGSWRHHDGWGVAYLDPERNFAIMKSSKAISKDPEAEKLPALATNFMIHHVRRKIGSEVSIKNTHPFKASHPVLGECIFCHNGFIKDTIAFDPRFKPKGKTDSERLFYSILSDINENKEQKIAATIQKNLHKYANTKGTNVVLATKEKTYVAIRKNKLPKYYGMMLGKGKDFLLISSEKLKMFPNIYWLPLRPGDVAVINNGTTNYSINKEKAPLLRKIAALIPK